MYPVGKFLFPDIPRPEQQPSLPALHYRLVTSTFPVPAYHFWLFTLCFSLKLLRALLDNKPLRFLALASKGNPLLQADKFKADLNDDRVREGFRSAERSTVLACWTAMT
jgi:hypothetical protein